MSSKAQVLSDSFIINASIAVGVFILLVVFSGSLLKIRVPRLRLGRKLKPKFRRTFRSPGKARKLTIGASLAIGFCVIGYSVYYVHTNILPIPILIGSFMVYDQDQLTWKKNLSEGNLGDLHSRFKQWSRDRGHTSGYADFWKYELLWHSGRYFSIGCVIFILVAAFGSLMLKAVNANFFPEPPQARGRHRGYSARKPRIQVTYHSHPGIPQSGRSFPNRRLNHSINHNQPYNQNQHRAVRQGPQLNSRLPHGYHSNSNNRPRN